MGGRRVAVLIPCRDEATTVATVVADFAAALPQACIYVYDNGSTDDTADRARAAGAVVRDVEIPGKGNVVRRMFADVEADVYVLVDGDATYDAGVAPALVSGVLDEGRDLVNASRRPEGDLAYRAGHELGNRMLAGLVSSMFARPVGDILSGYKACSRRLVKSFPAVSGGFEIETELMVHALEVSAPIAEVPCRYIERPPGSHSKLATYRDGTRILRTIMSLVRQGRPLAFFSAIGLLLLAVGVGFGIPVLITFAHTHLVPRLPTAVLSTGLVILAALSFTAGLLLDTVTRARREQRVLAYLAVPGPLAATGE